MPSIPGMFLLTGLHRTRAESSPSWRAAHLLREVHPTPAGAHPWSSLTRAPSRDPVFQQKQVCEPEPGRGSPGMGLVASSPAQAPGHGGLHRRPGVRGAGATPHTPSQGDQPQRSPCAAKVRFQKMDPLLWADWFHLIPFQNNVSRGPVVSPWKGARNLTGFQARPQPIGAGSPPGALRQTTGHGPPRHGGKRHARTRRTRSRPFPERYLFTEMQEI